MTILEEQWKEISKDKHAILKKALHTSIVSELTRTNGKKKEDHRQSNRNERGITKAHCTEEKKTQHPSESINEKKTSHILS